VHFVTRERVHVDRIATAWAIRRFVDPDATFEFVPRTRDLEQLPGIPFDIRGAELGHHDGQCTLEALIAKYEVDDEPLRRMARIIRSADQPQDESEPVIAAGVRAIFDGIRDGGSSDSERLEQGFIVCDALYTYCRSDPDSAAAF
jgi:hypothetical protein